MCVAVPVCGKCCRVSEVHYSSAAGNLLPAFRTFNYLDIARYYWGDQNMEGWVVDGRGRQGRGRKTCSGLVGRTAVQIVLRHFILGITWP